MSKDSRLFFRVSCSLFQKSILCRFGIFYRVTDADLRPDLAMCKSIQDFSKPPVIRFKSIDKAVKTGLKYASGMLPPLPNGI